ncbi:MAG: transposase, partial [Thermoprotei archaeon]
SVSVVFNKGKYYLHLHIPLELYAKHTTKVKVSSKAHLIAGFDINPDRICMVIVDTNGNIRDVKTKHFPEVTLVGFPKNKAKDLRLKALSELINYACYHNVKYFVFEKIRKIPKKKMKTKSASRKVSRFAYAELLQHAKVMVRKKKGKFVQVNPAFTSVDAIPLSRKLGLDIHVSSAYLLAIRCLKSINAY